MNPTRFWPHWIVVIGLLSLTSAAALRAQLSPKLQAAVGHWQTPPSDGKPGGQVETYIEGGKLYGRVTQLRPGHQPGDRCDKCSGDYKNQLILGLVIMRDFHPEADDWVEGTVLDPETGKVYKGKIWTVGKDELHMRGFIGISLLGRTETWTRIP